MSDDNQFIVPPSFIALFVPPGRSKPTAAREHISARYEFCEDLANLLTDHASNTLWELGISEEVVLERMQQGLLTDEATVTPPEAQWVICRLAELLGWRMPTASISPGSA